MKPNNKIFGAIDIGSNSTNLLIADSHGKIIERVVRSTQLGAGLWATGELSGKSIQQTVACIAEYWALMKSHNVSHHRIVATAACRDAKNTQEFFTEVNQAIGEIPELISGKLEGTLSFIGATSAMPNSTGETTSLVVDIGGASTELITGTNEQQEVISLPYGALTVSQAELHRDPPRPEELTNAISQISDSIDEVAHNHPEVNRTDRVIGIAGTIVTVAAIELGQRVFNPNELHGMVLTRQAVEEVFRTVATEPLRDRVFNPGLPRERAEIIVGGCCVLVAVMRRLQIDEIVVSQYNILDGIISKLRQDFQ